MPELVWAGYGKYRGWAYYGSRSTRALVVPGDEWATKALRVVAAPESGKVDAVQCYDAGVMSAGPFQATAHYGVLQRLLAMLQRADFALFERHVGEVLWQRSWSAVWGASDSWDARGKYAFYSLDAPETPLKARADLQRILLGGSDGVQWTRGQTAHAKAWVLSLVALLREESLWPTVARECAWMLGRYMHPGAKPVLDRVEPEPGVLRAVYLQFAVNHPAGALRLLKGVVGHYDERPDLLPATPVNVTSSMLQRARTRNDDGNPFRIPDTFPARARVVEKMLPGEFDYWQPS